jgi:Ca2+-binding EF-hand superfamily protein
MRPMYTSSALALLLALGGTAQAAQNEAQSSQQQATQQQATEQAVDRNGDGRISQDEARAHRERVFSSFDRNGDGRLSQQEISGIVAVEPGYVVLTRLIPVALTANLGSQAFAEMDQDQNQRVSRQEYMQYGERQFDQAQQHAGGKLSTADGQQQQAQSGEQQSGQQQSGKQQAQGAQQQSGQQQAQSGQQQNGQQQAQSGQQQSAGWQEVVRWREADVDRNGDDIVSADEAAGAWVETFHQLDQNGDDQLTQDEIDQAKAQKAMIDQRFAKLDANGDGLDEYSSAGHDAMDFADLDGDGDVTAWEYRAVRVMDR